MKQVKFKDLSIGDKFECYGDTYINYSYPKICVCIKVDEDTADEINGSRFGIAVDSIVFID